MSQKNQAAVALGKLGGQAGKGEAKRRSAELMRELQKKSVARRLANKTKAIPTNGSAVRTGVENSLK